MLADKRLYLGPGSALGQTKAVVALQVEPELRGNIEILAQAEGCIRSAVIERLPFTISLIRLAGAKPRRLQSGWLSHATPVFCLTYRDNARYLRS
jgi:hypothetical protein